MKLNFKHIFYLMVVAIFISCNSTTEEKIPTDVVKNPNTVGGNSRVDGLPEIDFEKTEHDFGTVIQGEVISYAFKFKNTGKSDLVITNVSTSCGCTASKYSKLPIPPGEEGSIMITFDSEGRKGFQNKTATVLSNTQPNKEVLRVKAKVITSNDL